MSQYNERYRIGTVDLFNVRNRNEVRIVEKLRDALAERGDTNLDEQTVHDIYALALNLLPARYSQSGTIVLREPYAKATSARQSPKR